MQQQDYAPLLEPGSHIFSMSGLKSLCVKNFNSEIRREIFNDFESFVEFVSAKFEKFELWCDGSFLTEKDAPRDIDVVVVLHLEEGMSSEQISTAYGVLDYKQHTPLIDSYLTFSTNSGNMQYWNELWQSDRSGNSKGYAVIKFGGDHG